MTPERTELEWVYEPEDYFEAEYPYSDSDFDLLINAGRATATLGAPQDPIEESLQNRIANHLEAVFLVRELLTSRKYGLQGPLIRQHTGAGKHVAVSIGEAVGMSSAVGHVDVIVRSTEGDVLRDTKKERITGDAAFLDAIAPKVARSSILRELLTSYKRSLSFPTHALGHLYEVRDALSTHYGSEQNARATLNITGAEWKRLGVLANSEPLNQGRHLGWHAGQLRDATGAELDEARSIVKRWILAFARTV